MNNASGEAKDDMSGWSMEGEGKDGELYVVWEARDPTA